MDLAGLCEKGVDHVGGRVDTFGGWVGQVGDQVGEEQDRKYHRKSTNVVV